MLQLRILAAGGLMELMAHFLSIGWGFATMVVMFVIVASRTTLTLNAASAKAASAHQRIDVLVPAVGAVKATADGAVQRSGDTVTGSLVVNGNHTIGGSLQGSGGTLSVSGNHHVTGAHTVDGTITGHSAINADGSMSASSIHTGGTGQFDNGVNIGGSTAISSGRAFSGASIHVSGNVLADSDVGMSSMNGAGLPRSTVSNSDGTLASTASAVNGVISRLRDVNILP